jgi:hypothetical protein
MTILDTTLDTSIWSDVRTLIVAAALAITNSTTGVVTSASVNGSYNDKSPTRPQIIINPVIIDRQNDKFGSINNKMIINLVIDCYAQDTLGMDQLAVGIQNTLFTNTLDGLDLIGMTQDVAFSSPGDQKYNLKSLVFSYQRE